MSALLLRGATVVDGTGGPPSRADVVVEDATIIAIGSDLEVPEAEVVDLTGLVLAPGFIDIHTHLDAQVLWDPDVTPSSWHGVTTVLMGNCGLGVAPTRPADRDRVLGMLINVEGMSPAALTAGIRWTFETFQQYLDELDRLPKRVNVGALVGHSLVRQYVMGDAASEREATADEIDEMRRIVRDALDAGALGFSTSRAQGHVGHDGRPVPSRVAPYDEIKTLVAEMRGRDQGMVELATGRGAYLAEFAELSVVAQRPVTWGALLTGLDYAALEQGSLRTAAPGTSTLDVLADAATFGGDVFPQVSCRELTFQFHLFEPFALANRTCFSEVLSTPPHARIGLYRDPAWRDRAREEMTTNWQIWYARTRVTETAAEPELIGRTLAEIAAERGCDPFDVIVDVSIAAELRARFTVSRANNNLQELAELLRDPRTLIGLSDAGAHADQLCDAVFATYLLGTWVRERGILPLETAVWRITGQPAAVLGLTDRGRIATGMVADLVAFDPATIGAGPNRRVNDLPTGADRLVADAYGVEHVWVGGVHTLAEGAPVPDAFAGTVIRAKRGGST